MLCLESNRSASNGAFDASNGVVVIQSKDHVAFSLIMYVCMYVGMYVCRYVGM